MVYDYFLRQRGYCPTKDGCAPGCVDTSKPCDGDFYWRDERTCVSIHDCNCLTHMGDPVAPGTAIQESECQNCQCTDNDYVCEDTCDDDIEEEVEIQKPITELPPTTMKVDEKENVTWTTSDIGIDRTLSVLTTKGTTAGPERSNCGFCDLFFGF